MCNLYRYHCKPCFFFNLCNCMSTLSRYTLNQGHALFLFLMIFLVIMSDIFNIVNQIRTRKLFMQIIFCFNPSICFLSNLLGFCWSCLGLCLLYLMGAIMHAQASTRLIGLIRVENSMHHFYLWQLLLLSFLQRHSWINRFLRMFRKVFWN